jgi:hypothetical protein
MEKFKKTFLSYVLGLDCGACQSKSEPKQRQMVFIEDSDELCFPHCLISITVGPKLELTVLIRESSLTVRLPLVTSSASGVHRTCILLGHGAITGI